MKVVISVKPMHSWSKNRGIGAYTREIVGALTSRFPEDQFVPTSHDYTNFDADIVHFPLFDPFFVTLPWRRSLPIIVTIHDLISVKYPKHYPRGIRGNIKWQIQKMLVKRADHIITDSEASAKDIRSILGISRSKIAVIPLAQAGKQGNAKLTTKIKTTYNLPDKYLLYVGDINWNKNVPGLIQAFAALKTPNLHLVLVGKVFQITNNIPEIKAIRKAVAVSGKSEFIHTVGYIPAEHLPGIFNGALLYVQPSWDEGFGLPILEAFEAGCPVASSNRGSLPEVGGNAVAYFDPAKNMTEVIGRVLQSGKERAELIAAGKKQLKQFSWERTAELTREVYAEVLANNR